MAHGMAGSRNLIRHKHSQCSEKQEEKLHSWEALRNLITCKYLQVQHHHQQPLEEELQKSMQCQRTKKSRQMCKKNQTKDGKKEQTSDELNKKCKRMKCSGSICSNAKLMEKPEILSPEKPKNIVPNRPVKSASLNDLNTAVGSRNSSSFLASPTFTGPLRNIPFRKFTGCYECKMVMDPVLGMTRDPSLRSTISSCPACGEVFMKQENLELHQAVRHAVTELVPEDSSKNIVEIIFQSSWLKKQVPVCKIDRILKVQNTPKTITKFEEYRDSIKAKATRMPKKHSRCLADGNELLRFHCTTVMCSLGINGSSNLCSSIPSCTVCSIIKHGFRVIAQGSPKGVLTTATSGRAHDSCKPAAAADEVRRAMLVCRVIAGRVKKNPDGNLVLEDYDSVGGAAGAYSNLDELYVFNPRAILPCFVIIYRGF